jgi:hypothetical protein
MVSVKIEAADAVGESLGRRYARPMPPNKGTHVRLEDELWARIDRYRKDHPDWPPPTRPQAIKEILELFFAEQDAKRAGSAKGKPK